MVKPSTSAAELSASQKSPGQKPSDSKAHGKKHRGQSNRMRSAGLKGKKNYHNDDEIERLQERVAVERPARGTLPGINRGFTSTGVGVGGSSNSNNNNNNSNNTSVAFRTLPLSQATLQGLEQEGKFTTMTEIQHACIPHALAGRDILAAAKTGSGKTLAFLVPTLERLYRERFTPDDGPGAVILVPTRELAVQIFQVLSKVGRHHRSLRAGLLIGGSNSNRQDFALEQQHVGSTNLILATPGRLLQHLEQTPYFDVAQLQILILDEADRILDMGFRDQLMRILEYVPASPQRQTMLFSATQTRDVKTLATLSLHQPEYLFVHEQEKEATPVQLQQYYVVVPPEHKLDAIFSFLKQHLQSKLIIFMASCAQVRHAWELFCALRPGIVVMALHGRLVQAKRTHIYLDFVQRPHAVLFATDIAARGLDFPAVDWVIQADAPEDSAMYIHRAGRTARYRARGKSLLIVTPSEEKNGLLSMLQQQQTRKEDEGDDDNEISAKRQTSNTRMPIQKLAINPKKAVVVSQRAAALTASNANLNRLAKKAVSSYLRSITLMPRQDIFRVSDIPLDDFAKAMGLASTPSLPFLKNRKLRDGTAATTDREELRKTKNVNRKLEKLKQQIKAEKLAKKLAKMGQTSSNENHATAAKQRTDSNESDDDDDLLVSKANQEHAHLVHVDILDGSRDRVTKPRRAKRVRIDGASVDSKHHVKFDDHGQEMTNAFLAAKPVSLTDPPEALAEASDAYLRKVRERLQENRVQDRLMEKERLRQLRLKRRRGAKGDVLPDGDPNDDDDNEEDVFAGAAYLTSVTPVENGEEDGSDSDSDESRSSETSASVASTSHDDDNEIDPRVVGDVKAHEDLALSLIRDT